MFRIGEFSRLARVSLRLLRYYDELGLLRPMHTDSSNGYRYYSGAQLGDLNRILVLRDLGLALDQIARVLQDGVSPEELRGMLLLRRAEIERARAEQAQQLRLIESRIAALESAAEAAPDDVLLRVEPARRYLSMRARFTSFAEAVARALELQREIPQRLGRAALGPFVVVSHSPEFDPDDLDLELGYTLQREPERSALHGAPKLELQTLPGCERVAACVRVGSPARAHLTTARIARFLAASGYRIEGPNRETFVQEPRDGDLETAVVEMAFPVVAAE